MVEIEGRRVVLKALVGSHNYNLNTVNSDRDYKYFVMPTFEDLYSGKRFSTAKQSEDVDYDVHDIRSLPELLWKSNINFIEVLFSIEREHDSQLGFLFADPEKYATMNLPYFFNATFGMHLEKMKTLFKGTAKTQHLVEKYGYDTKQGHHALRCLYTLHTFNKYQNMELAIRFHPDGILYKNLMDVKNNKVSIEKFQGMISDARCNAELLSEWYKAQELGELTAQELNQRIMLYIKDNLAK